MFSISAHTGGRLMPASYLAGNDMLPQAGACRPANGPKSW
jgi:hypothetical protein